MVVATPLLQWGMSVSFFSLKGKVRAVHSFKLFSKFELIFAEINKILL